VTTAGPQCSESCRSVDCCSSTCKSTKTTANSLFRPTHTVTVVACSNSQELKRRQLAHGARNRAGQLIVVQVPATSTKTTANSLVRPTHTVTVVACSNSQARKGRQLAHGDRNRARQLIAAQVPAKSTKATANSLVRPTKTRHPSSPLFQLTVP
jgi:hypothetical protein